MVLAVADLKTGGMSDPNRHNQNLKPKIFAKSFNVD